MTSAAAATSSGRSSVVKLSDKLLYALFILGAVCLAAFGLCALDWLWACATVLVVLFWAWVLHARCTRRDDYSDGR